MNVLIVGGGLGGLTAAACLIRNGYRVRLFEQAPELGEIGAGIQTSANAVKVLFELGLRDAMEEIAVRPQAFHFRRFDTGEIMHRIPLGENHERAHGAPYYHTHRADLQSLLLRTIRALDPDCITMGVRASGFEETEDGVILRFSDGTSAPGDVVIGADGIKSVIRQQILGHTPIIFTGDIAWRAVIPVDQLPKDFMDQVVTVWCGPKRHAVMYYIRSGDLFNFGGCVEREEAEGESWTQKRPWADLKRDFEGWHPDVQEVIDSIDKDSCYQWTLNNRSPVANWSTNRVTLIGDSAHPTLPYMAQGAVMAMEDAAVLTRCFKQAASVPDALQLYQRNRISRTARIVTESNAMRQLYRIEDTDEMRRIFNERDLARSRSEWLYSYDPLTVALD